MIIWCTKTFPTPLGEKYAKCENMTYFNTFLAKYFQNFLMRLTNYESFYTQQQKFVNYRNFSVSTRLTFLAKYTIHSSSLDSIGTKDSLVTVSVGEPSFCKYIIAIKR